MDTPENTKTPPQADVDAPAEKTAEAAAAPAVALAEKPADASAAPRTQFTPRPRMVPRPAPSPSRPLYSARPAEPASVGAQAAEPPRPEPASTARKAERASEGKLGRAMALCASFYTGTGGAKGWMRRPLFWLTIVPILLSILYFGIIATDMYVSEAEMVVRNSKAFTADSGPTILTGSSSSQNPDSYVVYEYVRSQDLMRILDAELNLRKHYGRPGADPLSRLWGRVTDEDLLKFYQSVVSVTLDSSTGIIKLKVRAFDAETAHRLAQKVIKYSEALVNRMSERSVQDTLGLAQAELSRAEARVNAARLKIKEFRTTHADFNPTATASATMSTLAGLLDDHAKANAELNQMRSYMREDSPQVSTAKARVAALARQIATEQARLTGGGSGKTSEVLEYETLSSEYEFAQKQLEGARSVMEQSRVQAHAKTRYLEPFVQPNLPEESTYPERLKGIGLSIVIAFLAYGLVMLVWASIREHAGF